MIEAVSIGTGGGCRLLLLIVNRKKSSFVQFSHVKTITGKIFVCVFSPLKHKRRNISCSLFCSSAVCRRPPPPAAAEGPRVVSTDLVGLDWLEGDDASSGLCSLTAAAHSKCKTSKQVRIHLRLGGPYLYANPSANTPPRRLILPQRVECLWASNTQCDLHVGCRGRDLDRLQVCR